MLDQKIFLRKIILQYNILYFFIFSARNINNQIFFYQSIRLNCVTYRSHSSGMQFYSNTCSASKQLCFSNFKETVHNGGDPLLSSYIIMCQYNNNLGWHFLMLETFTCYLLSNLFFLSCLQASEDSNIEIKFEITHKVGSYLHKTVML